ncbi:sugar phosphate isomerase/epimerase family protein [Desertimonas flava]|uniref:sugar phosphate isomerase/epimerase family protein n=1 Tax=Desertimonas flava TaxID=2064846 RepID=UPI000E352007|nr:sugar phosphate isomerase/epimerase family protein [Desertimonas flava]
MRLGFSTLGCSGDPLASVVRLAVSSGWTAVELRAGPDEPVHVGLSMPQRDQVRRTLADAGVGPIAVASYIRVADPDADTDAVVAELVAHARLAADVGAPYVRVFPGGDSERPAESDEAAVACLGAAARALADVPVSLALETHDSHRRGTDVARVLDRVDHPSVRAIWDALHPWLAGEPPAETATALRERIAYVQIKDVASSSDLTPVLPGTGALPLGDIAALALEIVPDGWLSLEWESKWFPTAPPLTDALNAATELVRAWEGYPSPGRRTP